MVSKRIEGFAPQTQGKRVARCNNLSISGIACFAVALTYT